jgi:hypothetical protein
MNDEQENKDSYRKRNRFYYGRVYPGIWLIIIGVFFLLSNFGYLNGEVWGKLWPLFIIIPGVFMVLRSRQD